MSDFPQRRKARILTFTLTGGGKSRAQRRFRLSELAVFY